MDQQGVLLLMLRLLGILAVIQGIEFHCLRKYWSDDGIWRWVDLRSELHGFELVLAGKSFLVLNWVRLLLGLVAIVQPSAGLAVALLVMHVLTLLRWRGSFNGGSDYMNLMLLLGVSAGLVFAHIPAVGWFCLWYMTLQLALSYYRAGYVKVKNRQWRSGEALGAFMGSPRYQQGPWSLALLERPKVLKFAAWVVMIFELSFPLSLLGPNWALAYMTVGFFFHLSNSYWLGLNRFFFAWLAAYPALYFAIPSF